MLLADERLHNLSPRSRLREYCLYTESLYDADETECDQGAIGLRGDYAHCRRCFRLHLYLHGHQSSRHDESDQRTTNNGIESTNASRLVGTSADSNASSHVAAVRFTNSTPDSACFGRRLR